MVRPEESEETPETEGTESYSPSPDYIDQDYNGLWFVLNQEGFPVSPAFATEAEAEMWKRELI